MMAMMSLKLLVLFNAVSSVASSTFVVSSNPRSSSSFASPTSNLAAADRLSARSTPTLFLTPSDAIATLDASQKASTNEIATVFPDLAIKPDLSWKDGEGVMIDGAAALLEAREAPGAPANIAWLASVMIASKLSSLTIFCGPLTDVPHLLSKVAVVNADKLHFALDFRPRAYGAYEQVDAQGNYPGPDVLGRKAFEYSGARNDYFSKFATDEVKAWMESIKSTLVQQGGGVVETSSTPSELQMLTQGPLALSIIVPLTEQSLATIVSARQQAVSYWLSWARDHDTHAHRPGAPINTQYVYDAKYRQQAYGALLDLYSTWLGTDGGAKLAAAESGPLDEAYVGGAS